MSPFFHCNVASVCSLANAWYHLGYDVCCVFEVAQATWPQTPASIRGVARSSCMTSCCSCGATAASHHSLKNNWKVLLHESWLPLCTQHEAWHLCDHYSLKFCSEKWCTVASFCNTIFFSACQQSTLLSMHKSFLGLTTLFERCWEEWEGITEWTKPLPIFTLGAWDF